jgi:hypothetical protein
MTGVFVKKPNNVLPFIRKPKKLAEMSEVELDLAIEEMKRRSEAYILANPIDLSNPALKAALEKYKNPNYQ